MLRERHGWQVSLHVYCTFFLCAIFALLLLSASALAQERKTHTVPFHTVRGMILLDGQLNGKLAVLLLDTGAQITTIDAKFSDIPRKGNNANGVVSGARFVKVASLCLGSHCFSDRAVGIIDLSQVSNTLGARVDAVIGEDLLQTFSGVRIDYKAHTVTLEE